MYARGKQLHGEGAYTWPAASVGVSRTELRKDNVKIKLSNSSQFERKDTTVSELKSPQAKAHTSFRTIQTSIIISNMLARQRRLQPIITDKSFDGYSLDRRLREIAAAKEAQKKIDAVMARLDDMFTSSLDKHKLFLIGNKSVCSHGLAKDFVQEHSLPSKYISRVHSLVKTTRASVAKYGGELHLLAVTIRRVRMGAKIKNLVLLNTHREVSAALEEHAEIFS
jgi:hypothetical protein